MGVIKGDTRSLDNGSNDPDFDIRRKFPLATRA